MNLVFWCIPICSFSQLNSKIFVDGQFEMEKSFQDTVSLARFVESKKIAWINQGYFFSGLDSIINSNEGFYNLYLHKGVQSNIEVDGFGNKKLYHKLTKYLGSYIDSGYPFASITIDSMFVSGEIMKGKINVFKGPQIRYDSAFFLKPIKSNHKYIYQLLSISPGDLYRESSYTAINDKIERSNFLSLSQPPEISFSGDKARVFLNLEEKTSNSFQGILGLQQKPEGGSSVVGSLDLSFENLFRSGHEFQFNWESFAEASQRLDLYYKHAFFLGARFSPSFRFGLIKQDTSFLTRTTAIGINTFLGSKTQFHVEFEGLNGSLISSDVEFLSERNLADFKRNFYQIGISRGNLSQLNSYVKGSALELYIGAGTKEIERNVSIPSSYYDTLALKTTIFQFSSRFSYQIKIAKRQSIYQDIQIGFLENDEILTNELYRIGGLSTLRGFNEKSFFVSKYALSRLEFRSFFENESFFYAFYDQMIFRRFSGINAPSGIGLGFALATSSGQFSFALASGQSKDQRLSFAELRVHFGFITRF